MRRGLLLIPLAGVFLVQSMWGQANVSVPASVRTASAAPGGQVSDCRSEATTNSNGDLEFTDCTGKSTHVDRKTLDSSGAAGQSQPPSALAADLDPQTRTKQQEALRAKFDYQAFSFAHAKRTFDFQYWSGEVIFFAVLAIVLAGLAFSAVQFYVGLRHPMEAKKKPGGTTPAAEDSSVSEFEATLQGIKLKSSVLGLIILGMSMVFFYLYLKFVYPISNISQ